MAETEFVSTLPPAPPRSGGGRTPSAADVAFIEDLKARPQEFGKYAVDLTAAKAGQMASLIRTGRRVAFKPYIDRLEVVSREGTIYVRLHSKARPAKVDK